jgi:hypothetical protein
MQFAWLKYFTYQLVPVLAPNYKQHILLFISWTLWKIGLFEFIRVEGGVIFGGGGATSDTVSTEPAVLSYAIDTYNTTIVSTW